MNIARLGISSIISILITKLVITKLGLKSYGLVTLTLTFVSVISLMSNAVTSATTKIVVEGVENKKFDLAGEFIINTMMLIVLSIIFLSALSGALFAQNLLVFTKEELLYSLVVLVSVGISGVGGIFCSCFFVKEQFLVREIIFTGNRLIYCLLSWALLEWTRLGIWSLAWGGLIAEIITFLLFLKNFKKLLPQISLRIERIKIRVVKDIVTYVGWLFLVYGGTYIARSGILYLVAHKTPNQLGELSISMTVSGMLLQVLTSIGLLTSPAILKSMSNQKVQEVEQNIIRFIKTATFFSVPIIIGLYTEGPYLISLWLGSTVPKNIHTVMVIACWGVLLSSYSVPVTVCFSATEKLKYFGLVTIVESLIIVYLTYIILIKDSSNLGLVLLLPGLIGLIKNGIVTYFLERKYYTRMPIVLFVEMPIMITVLSALSIASRNLFNNISPFNGAFALIVHLLAICLPLFIVIILHKKRKINYFY